MAWCSGEDSVPTYEGGYLRNRVVGMVGAEDEEWMAGLVVEALRV